MGGRRLVVPLLLGAVLVATVLANEPRRVRVTLRDGSVVEGTLEGVKDGAYTVKVGGTSVTLVEDDVKKVEFVDPKPEKKPDAAPAKKPEEKKPEEKKTADAAKHDKLEVPGIHGGTIRDGLKWLARHQASSGKWSAHSYANECRPGAPGCRGTGMSDFDVGLTGLAVLAFLEAGFTPASTTTYLDEVTEKPVTVGDVVKRGLAFLGSSQNGDGSIGPNVGERMYNDAIATLAVCEAYRLTKEAGYRDVAKAAVAHIEKAQNPGLGWRYTPRCGNSDTSVSGWCVRALLAAKAGGLTLDPESLDGAIAWFDRVTEKTGETGYDRKGSGEIYVPGKNEEWKHHPTMSAIGLLCRVGIEGKDDLGLAKTAAIVQADVPKWETGAHPTIDYYYWHHGTLALAALHGPDGAAWKKWRDAVVNALEPNQRTRADSCNAGSWDSDGTDRWAYAGGRIYTTAINVLTLEALNGTAK